MFSSALKHNRPFKKCFYDADINIPMVCAHLLLWCTFNWFSYCISPSHILAIFVCTVNSAKWNTRQIGVFTVNNATIATNSLSHLMIVTHHKAMVKHEDPHTGIAILCSKHILPIKRKLWVSKRNVSMRHLFLRIQNILLKTVVFK